MVQCRQGAVSLPHRASEVIHASPFGGSRFQLRDSLLVRQAVARATTTFSADHLLSQLRAKTLYFPEFSLAGSCSSRDETGRAPKSEPSIARHRPRRGLGDGPCFSCPSSLSETPRSSGCLDR